MSNWKDWEEYFKNMELPKKKDYMMKADIFNDGLGFIELIDMMGGDHSIISSARVSHYVDSSKGEDADKKLIHYLMKNRHTSPFESCVLTFRIKVPLFVRGQWHRHRTWSYNEVSRRYTSENINEFFYPEEWRAQDTKNKQSSIASEKIDSEYWNDKLKTHVNISLSLYNRMIEAGVAREQARMVLPQNMYTMYYGTVNLHNLLHFLSLRIHPHAQEEIRMYANAIAGMLSYVVPIAYEAWWEYHGQHIVSGKQITYQ